MKKLICLIVSIVMIQSLQAQELYQYAKDSVITTSVGQIYISGLYGSHVSYSKPSPVFNQNEQATCSDPTFKRDEYGRWIVDKTKFNKPQQSIIRNTVMLNFAQYRTLLKTAFDGKGQIWITFQTNSAGLVKNAEVIIWAEPSVYCQIPPTVLCNLLNSIDNLQFGIPAEYQCISDHYFRYSVLFKDL